MFATVLTHTETIELAGKVSITIVDHNAKYNPDTFTYRYAFTVKMAGESYYTRIWVRVWRPGTAVAGAAVKDSSIKTDLPHNIAERLQAMAEDMTSRFIEDFEPAF